MSKYFIQYDSSKIAALDGIMCMCMYMLRRSHRIG